MFFKQPSKLSCEIQCIHNSTFIIIVFLYTSPGFAYIIGGAVFLSRDAVLRLDNTKQHPSGVSGDS